MRGRTSPQGHGRASTGCWFAVLAFALVPLEGCSTFVARDPYAGVPEAVQRIWLEELAGKRITLPALDSRGAPIPRTDAMFVATLNCTDCLDPSSVIRWTSKAATAPVILIVRNASRQVAAELSLHPESHRIILADADGLDLPQEMLSFAPQIAEVDRAGVILRVPNELQSLSDFVSRTSRNRGE